MTGFEAHMAEGATTVARAWALRRTDGVELGFTDHDADLEFAGVRFRAGAGLSASALAHSTGLAVDNTEASGALCDSGLSEADILAGRYDGAELRIWQVNWADVAQRRLIFRGTLGEITRVGAAFRAELRGLAEALGQPQGRIYQPDCTAVLGDAQCRFDVTAPGFTALQPVETVEDRRVFRFAQLAGFEDRWFETGHLQVQDGPAAGLGGVIKNDRLAVDGARRIELWQALAAPLRAGDTLRLIAGCDKRASTCRLKFGNLVNFRGFPFIPGEDWLMAVPRSDGRNDGGSLAQ